MVYSITNIPILLIVILHFVNYIYKHYNKIRPVTVSILLQAETEHSKNTRSVC
jgi:hypothetical protein